LRSGTGVLDNARVLTLGEVLGHTGFGLRLLTGGDVAGERPVAGAHSSEMPGPSQFLPRDWMMLTLGMKLRGSSDAQRALIAELDDSGLCALGFGVGVAFEHVPRALRDEAASRGFPVFEIPFDTPYREIIGFVNRSLLSTDFRLVHRSLSMQNYLMDALREEAPMNALVHRLGELLDSTIVIFDARGQIEAASRDAPFEAIWQQVSAQQPSIQRALIDGSDILAIPIQPAGHPRRWLVVASRRRALPRQLALSVIQSTERLLELVTLSQRAAAAEERVVRAELLTSALEPQRGYDSIELQARMRRYRVDFGASARILAIEPRTPSVDALDRARVALEMLLEDEALPYLMAVRPPQLVALVQAEPARIAALLGRLAAERDEELVAGGGRPVRGVADVPRSLRDAGVALRQLSVRGAPGLLLFEDFDVATWLVGITPPADMAAKVDSILGPLREHPELYETLVAYLRSHMKVTATARSLNLHENSLRYRLSRIEELLDCSLRELPTIVDLYMATLAAGTDEARTAARDPL